MNKKLIGNLILLALVVALGLSFLDMGKKTRTYQEQIAIFILDNLEEGTQYEGLSFEEINEAYLMAKEEINKPLITVADTIRNQLNLLQGQYLSLELKQAVQKAENHLASLNLENVSDYLSIDAEIKRGLKAAGGLDRDTKAALYQEESRMLDAINDLNAALGQFNLSVFNVDFNQTETIRYYHEYRMSDDRGSSIQAAVFELNKQTKEVLSFREVSNVG